VFVRRWISGCHEAAASRYAAAAGWGRAWLSGPLWVALCGLFGASSAMALNIIVLEDECRGRQLLLQGTVEPGDAQRVAAALGRLITSADLPNVQDPETLWTVKLDIPGGDLTEAMRIGRWLRAAYATTETSYRYARRADGIYDFEPAEGTICLDGSGALDGCFADVVKAECAGACLLIWLAGTERYAHEGQLGVHGLAGDPEMQASVTAYLAELGVEASRYAGWFGSDATPKWLPWPERNALGGRTAVLETALAACPARLRADESLDSVMHIDAEVRAALMERAEGHRACRLVVVERARAAVETRLRADVARPGGP
jgi:hypothetical protein